jgi:PleD family two-component response regulator
MVDRDAMIQEKINLGGGKASYKCLVIDDDNWNYRIISRYLTKYKMETLYADSGYEGLIAAINNDVDLIFLDLVLPDVPGSDLLQLLRKIRYTREIPIVVLSANIEVNLIKLARKYDVKDFVSKPYKESTIVDKLRNIFFDDPIFDML